MTTSGLNLPSKKPGKDELGPLVADTHQYRVVAWWASARTGTAKSGLAPQRCRQLLHNHLPSACGTLKV